MLCIWKEKLWQFEENVSDRRLTRITNTHVVKYRYCVWFRSYTGSSLKSHVTDPFMIMIWLSAKSSVSDCTQSLILNSARPTVVLESKWRSSSLILDPSCSWCTCAESCCNPPGIKLRLVNCGLFVYVAIGPSPGKLNSSQTSALSKAVVGTVMMKSGSLAWTAGMRQASGRMRDGWRLIMEKGRTLFKVLV